MLLQTKFKCTKLNLSLELFLRILFDYFGNRMKSVILYGSIIYDDLAPGFGDLDFVVALNNYEISEKDLYELKNIRKSLRSGYLGIYSEMLEGSFIPKEMLYYNIDRKGIWWGTGSESMADANHLAPFSLKVIKGKGIIIYGEDIRDKVIQVTDEMLMGEAENLVISSKKYGKGGTFHSPGWLLSIARMILWLRENRFSSKSEAADWGSVNIKGEWGELLTRCKYLRNNPQNINLNKDWLNKLTPYILKASQELKEEIDNRR